MSPPLISSADCLTILNDENTVIVDCRFDLKDKSAGVRAFEEDHIPNAIYADLERDLSSAVTSTSGRHPLPQFPAFQLTLQSWGVTSTSNVVVYDNCNDGFAARAWWLARWAGLQRVYVLDGGYSVWRQSGYQTTKSVKTVTRSTFSSSPNTDMALTTHQVIQLLERHELILIDARDPERYQGLSEPIDKKAGHIPGARNLPFKGNLAENGQFLPKSHLRNRFEAALPTTPLGVAHMCGSGVTACSNILAMVVAGFPQPKLYAGSWSEWIQNESLPIATGSSPLGA